METIYTVDTFNALMLVGILIALVAIRQTKSLNKKLSEQKIQDQVREDKLLNGSNRLAH